MFVVPVTIPRQSQGLSIREPLKAAMGRQRDPTDGRQLKVAISFTV